jgi:hypothetical protein
MGWINPREIQFQIGSVGSARVSPRRDGVRVRINSMRVKSFLEASRGLRLGAANYVGNVYVPL